MVYKFLILVVICLTYNRMTLLSAKDNQCPPPQQYFNCGSPCRPTCNDLSPLDPFHTCRFIDVCGTGCFCPPDKPIEVSFIFIMYFTVNIHMLANYEG